MIVLPGGGYAEHASIGSFVAQEVTLIRPAIARRVVLASSAPQGAAGMHGWAPGVIGAVGTPLTSPEEYLDVFFARSDPSRQAGQAALKHMYARNQDRDTSTNWATRQAQYDAVCNWGVPDHAALQRVSAIKHPVFVANGDSDPMILPHYSYLLAGLIPQAKVKIYPDAAHGFLFQHHAEFAADVEAFLSAPRWSREVCLPRPAESGSQGAGQQRSDPSCGLIDEHFPRLAIPRQALRNVRRTSIFMHAARPDEAVA
jgi:pimeloyl-ACP methyl ester carboxylesterase